MKIIRLSMEDTHKAIPPIYISMEIIEHYMDILFVLKKLCDSFLEEYDKLNKDKKHKDVEIKIIDNQISWRERLSLNEYANIDRMCSHCGGYADIVDELAHIKLCQNCYEKLEE